MSTSSQVSFYTNKIYKLIIFEGRFKSSNFTHYFLLNKRNKTDLK